MASFSRPTLANHRGDFGRKGSRNARNAEGMNCIPHAARKDAGPEMNWPRKVSTPHKRNCRTQDRFGVKGILEAYRATVAEEVHDQNSELASELLKNNNGASRLGFCDLSEVDRCLGSRDTDAETIDDTASNQSAPILAANLDSCADEPEQVGEPDGISSTPSIGAGTRNHRADD